VNHIPEADLALYALAPDALPDHRRTEIAAHLHNCYPCTHVHATFLATDEAEIDDEARDPLTWEPIVGSDTHESSLAIAARLEDEERRAAVDLQEFLESPTNAAWTMAVSRKRTTTAGAARLLCKAAHGICEENPLAAIIFADNAVAITEALSEDDYPPNVRAQLQGRAWKEHANAQMLLGKFPEAHQALDRAERAYRKAVAHSSLGLSQTALVRAGVFYEQGLLADAMASAERAEFGFSHIGDEDRRMDAVFLRASIMYEAGRGADAITQFQRLMDYGEETSQPRWVARGAHGIATCYVDLGNLNEASMHFHTALMLFRRIGPEPDRVAVEWGIARMFLKSGKVQDAVFRLRAAQEEFESRNMVTDAALVGLDIVEALLALGRTRQIARLAQHLFGVFTRAGMITGALSALAYLQEAATKRTLTPLDLHDMRVFLRRAERQPSLVFAPAPRGTEDRI
jgi:tetratricopeptide (TPR) repeat protein